MAHRRISSPTPIQNIRTLHENLNLLSVTHSSQTITLRIASDARRGKVLQHAGNNGPSNSWKSQLRNHIRNRDSSRHHATPLEIVAYQIQYQHHGHCISLQGKCTHGPGNLRPLNETESDSYCGIPCPRSLRHPSQPYCCYPSVRNL